MIPRAAVLACALGAFGCRDIAGIKPIAYSDAGSSACSAPAATTLHTGGIQYTSIYAAGGFVYLESAGGVDRCAETGCQSGTSPVATPATSSTFESSTLAGSVIDYSVLGATSGEIRSVGVDGTGDTSVASNLQSPFYLATSGSRLFWVDDSYGQGSGTSDSVSCIGCSGTTSTPWIASTAFAGGIYALVANAQNVYVLADDAAILHYQLVSCPVAAPCGATPQTLLTNVDPTTLSTQLATDGTYVYLARSDHADVVRVDGTGQVTQIVTSLDVTAIAIDAAAGNLYYGTSTGLVGRAPTAGGGTGTTLTCVSDPIVALAVDSAVFFVAGPVGGTLYSTPK